MRAKILGLSKGSMKGGRERERERERERHFVVLGLVILLSTLTPFE